MSTTKTAPVIQACKAGLKEIYDYLSERNNPPDSRAADFNGISFNYYRQLPDSPQHTYTIEFRCFAPGEKGEDPGLRIFGKNQFLDCVDLKASMETGDLNWFVDGVWLAENLQLAKIIFDCSRDGKLIERINQRVNQSKV